MMVDFYIQAFWGFLVLVAALVAVIYNLFNSKLEEKFKNQANEIEDKITKEFEEKFNKKIEKLGADILAVKNEVESIKNHDKNTNKFQNDLLERILKKLDKIDPNIFIDAINNG